MRSTVDLFAWNASNLSLVALNFSNNSKTSGWSVFLLLQLAQTLLKYGNILESDSEFFFERMFSGWRKSEFIKKRECQ